MVMEKLKKLLISILITVFAFTGILVLTPMHLYAGAAYYADNGSGKYKPKEYKEIIIKYKDEKKSDATKAAVKNKLKLGKMNAKQKIKKHKMEVVALSDTDNIDNTIQELRKDPNVEYVQPNYKLEVSTLPFDSRFGEQWGLLNAGQDIEGQIGRTGVDINASPAWDLSRGVPSVVVGILDTGIDIGHAELSGNIYANSGEIPGNGVDDDNNGYIDDVNGWDFYNGDSSVFDSSEQDTHGTHMAGIIAASSDSEGITGVAPNIRIMPLKFMSGDSGYTSSIIEAIDYASQMGVKIINCSFGSTNDNPALKDAMQNSGILFVCSAGNRGEDTAASPVYPAAFEISNILSVAAIDSKGVLAPFSSYGSNVDIAAPGVNILTTVPGDGYEHISGTSTAAPLACGAAALLKSYLPQLSAGQIVDRINNNAVACTNLEGKVAAGGRLDTYAALCNIKPQADEYNGPGNDCAVIPPGEQGTGDDSWYTMDQLSNLQERIHYGESGISPATGNYSFTCNDMTMESPGFNINISRTYNSKETKSTSLGRGWTFGFEGRLEGGTVVTVTLPNGSIESFIRFANSYMAKDSRSRLVINGDGTHVLTTKDQYSYGFNSSGILTWMKDRNGNTITIELQSGTKKVTGITDAAGRHFTVNYNAKGLIDNISDPIGRIVSYSYDPSYTYLIAATDTTGNVMNYHYDGYGYMDEIRDNNNNLLLSLTYDHTRSTSSGARVVKATDHRVVKTVDALGSTRQYNFDTANRKTTIEENGARSWTYWFDDTFRTIKTQDPEGRFTYTEYYLVSGNNKFGDIKSTTDRNGNKTQYEIDSYGNVTKQTNPDLSCKEYAYDSNNNLTMEMDELSKCIYYIYDNNKINMQKKVQPLNGTDAYTQGVSNDADYSITSYSYYTDAECQQLGYKAKGLLKSVTDPNNHTISYTYYDNGYIRTKTDAEGKTRTYHYNDIGWMDYELTPKGYKLSYQYNGNGQLEKEILDGGETTRIVYNILGQKVKEVSPNQYAPALDDMANHTYSGDHGYRYTYYESGFIKTETDPNNNTTAYTYDQYGNTATETKPNGAVYEYRYDSMDRLTKVLFRENAAGNSVLLEEYSYAVLDGGRTQKTETKYLNDTEKAITIYVYDYAGRVVEQQNPDGTRTRTSYHSNGEVKSTIDRKGSITLYRYDGLSRLSEKWVPFEEKNGNTYYTYTKILYDNANNIKCEKLGKTKVFMLIFPLEYVTKTYDYYRNNLLKSVIDNEGRKTEYQYDDDGNVKLETVYINGSDTKVTEYEYNHLEKVSRKKVHVKKGDLVDYSFGNTEGTVLETTYAYDKNGNVETVTTPDQVTTRYYYDSMNMQIRVSKPGKDEYNNACDIVSSTTYNWEGKPETQIDANGSTTTITYNKRGFIDRIKDPRNGITAYNYDRAGRKTAVVAPAFYKEGQSLDTMVRSEYVYDLMGRVKLEKYFYIVFSPERPERPDVLHYEGDIDGYLTDVMGPVEDYFVECYKTVPLVTKAYKYDINGNVIKELDALGYSSGTGTSEDEKIESGYGKEYMYNLAGLVVAYIDPVSKDKGLAYTAKFEYDVFGRKISETDAKGAITQYKYDDAGNVLRISKKKNSSAAINTIKVNTYDYIGRLLTSTDANEKTTGYEYNAMSKLRRAVIPGDATIPGNIITYQYDNAGNLKKTTDSTGAENIFTYDSNGRQLSQTRQQQGGSDAITVTARYDKNGNKRFETDGNGNLKEYIYNRLNQLTSTRYTAGGITKETFYTHDANGNQLTMTDWRGNTYTNMYDEFNRVIARKNPYSTIEVLVYNDNNIQTESHDALGNCTKYTYDKNNRLVSTEDAEGHKTFQTYDNAGNIAAKTDGKGNTTAYEYDEFNRLKSVTNAKGEKTSYIYDGNGNMLTQTDGNANMTSYEYNAANKLVKRISYGGRTGLPGRYRYVEAKVESYTYYADGSIHTKNDRSGNTTEYVYDVHGRLKEQTAGGSTTAYTYDGNGNMLTMTDKTGTTVYTYDGENRTLTKTVPGIGEISWQYDILEVSGRVAEKATDPKGNITVKVYDKADRLAAVTAEGGTTSYSYYANGSRKSVTYPDGSTETYTYYKDNLNKTLVNKKANGTVIDSYSYTYDAAHNQTSKTDAKGVTGYTYDKLNRLEKVTEPGNKTTSYTYDGAGNRLTEAVITGTSTITTTYSYDTQNRMTGTVTEENGTTERVKYNYDNNGNLVYKAKLTTKPVDITKQGSFAISVSGISGTEEISIYEYDELNQLIKTTSGGKTISYEYNGLGLRVEKTVNTQTTKYLYEGDKVVLELDGQGNQTARNVQGTNTIARTADGETLYYMYNGHGDVTALLDAAGTIAATYYYDAFGNITDTTGEASNPFRYAGYQYDEETGIYYLNARYYDPKIARFLTEDTYLGSIADPLSLNLYAYCANNPIMYVDPTGHAFTEWDDKNVKSEKDRQAIMEATKEWAEASKIEDKEERKKAQDAAHEKAEKARKNYRDDDEYGRNDGYTVRKESNNVRDDCNSKVREKRDREYSRNDTILYDTNVGSFVRVIKSPSSNSNYRNYSVSYMDKQRELSVIKGNKGTGKISVIDSQATEQKKGVIGVGIAGALHFLGGVSGGKVVYFDRNGNIALMNSTSFSAINDVEVSVSGYVEGSLNASTVEDMEGTSTIGGFGGDPGIGLGLNYQWSKSDTSSIQTHSISASKNVSLMPVEVLAGKSTNKTIIQYNTNSKELKVPLPIFKLSIKINLKKFNISIGRDKK